MKKVYIYLTLFFCIFIYSTLLGQPPIIIESPGFYIGELILQDWDTDWNNQMKYNYTYDGLGRKTGALYSLWNSTSDQWEKSDTMIYSYNTDNSIYTITDKKWNGNSWNIKARYQYTYNTEGKELKEEVNSWNGNTWQDSLMNTTTYDLDGYISTYLQQEWDGTAWQDTRRDTYTVNPDGTNAQKLEEFWGAGWMFSTRSSYTYQDGKVTEEQIEHHNGLAWSLDTKFTLTYDGDLLTSSLTQHWNGNITAWVDDRKFTHTYNTDGSISYSVNQEWTPGGWNDLAKFSYTYTSLTKINPPQSSAFVNISPNPFTEYVQIDFSEDNLPAELKLYNVHGIMVRQLTLNSSNVSIDVEDLTVGNYYGCISSKDKVLYKKLIKIE